MRLLGKIKRNTEKNRVVWGPEAWGAARTVPLPNAVSPLPSPRALCTSPFGPATRVRGGMQWPWTNPPRAWALPALTRSGCQTRSHGAGSGGSSAPAALTAGGSGLCTAPHRMQPPFVKLPRGTHGQGLSTVTAACERICFPLLSVPSLFFPHWLHEAQPRALHCAVSRKAARSSQLSCTHARCMHRGGKPKGLELEAAFCWKLRPAPGMQLANSNTTFHLGK